MRRTFSTIVPPRLRFCSFFASFSDSSLVLSMPTKTAADIGLDHQLHQLLVVGEIDRGLGDEHERIAVAPSARSMTWRRTSLIAFLLPIRLSSTMKTIRQLAGAQGFELGDDLAAGLEARAPAEDHDDVAELAGERAAARELHRAEGVPLHLEKVEARRRDPGHVGLLRLLVAARMPATLPVARGIAARFPLPRR